jgi:hypothetical protein
MFQRYSDCPNSANHGPVQFLCSFCVRISSARTLFHTQGAQTTPFKKSQNKKYKDIKSGDLGGHETVSLPLIRHSSTAPVIRIFDARTLFRTHGAKTTPFKKSQNKKYKGVKSGDLGGHETVPLRLIRQGNAHKGFSLRDRRIAKRQTRTQA